MLKILQYLIAYLSLIGIWFILIFLVLRVFNYIEGSGGAVGLMLFAFGLNYIYDKLKPMEFKELLILMKKNFKSH